MCEAFARYTMLDSARHCLEQSRAKKTPSNEIKIRWELTDASVDIVTNNYEAAKVHYDSAFKIIRTFQPSLRIAQRAYLKVMTHSAFFGDCTYGLGLADEFIQLCKQNEDDSLLMEGLIYKARFLECIDENDSTHLALFERAEMLCLKNPALYGPYYEFLGNYHYYFDRLPKAIEYCLLAENAYKESGDMQRLEGHYLTFSSAYESMSDFERALEYAMIVQPLIDETVDETWDEFYNTLGWIYYRNGEVDSALSAIRRSVLYHQKLTPGNPEIAYPIGNLALIFKQIGELDSAKIYSTQAVALFHKLNHELGVAEAFNNLGLVAMEEGKRDSAILYFELPPHGRRWFRRV